MDDVFEACLASKCFLHSHGLMQMHIWEAGRVVSKHTGTTVSACCCWHGKHGGKGSKILVPRCRKSNANVAPVEGRVLGCLLLDSDIHFRVIPVASMEQDATESPSDWHCWIKACGRRCWVGYPACAWRPVFPKCECDWGHLQSWGARFLFRLV